MIMRLQERLTAELGSFGIDCSEAQCELLLRHLMLVIERNRAVNLTRITDAEEAVTLHIVDSLLPLACKGFSLDHLSSFLDMGTGAGFPGIPFAVMTGSSATLVDSVGKKVAAVSDFAETLGLSKVRAVHARLEELAREIPGTQELVIARAVARTNVLVEYSTPFLKTGGLLVVEKGRPNEEELSEARRAAAICGLEVISRETFELPHDLGHREILAFVKQRKPKIKLPRRVGLAKHDPLGML